MPMATSTMSPSCVCSKRHASALWAHRRTAPMRPRLPGQSGIAETVSGITIPSIFAEASETTELLVASHAIEYRRPIPYRAGPIAIDLVISEVKPASVTIGYSIAEPDGSVGYTLAETVIVFVDRTTSRPRRLTQEETAAMEDVIRPAVPMRGRNR